MSGHYRSPGSGNAVKVIQTSQRFYSLTEKGRSWAVSADDLRAMIDSGTLVKERDLGERRRSR